MFIDKRSIIHKIESLSIHNLGIGKVLTRSQGMGVVNIITTRCREDGCSGTNDVNVGVSDGGDTYIG